MKMHRKIALRLSRDLSWENKTDKFNRCIGITVDIRSHFSIFLLKFSVPKGRNQKNQKRTFLMPRSSCYPRLSGLFPTTMTLAIRTKNTRR